MHLVVSLRIIEADSEKYSYNSYQDNQFDAYLVVSFLIKRVSVS
jgi:hypothetical protein